MKRQEEAICLRIFIGESDRYGGKPLSLYLLEIFKKADLAGAKVVRGIAGFGKNSSHPDLIHPAALQRSPGGDRSG